MLRLVLTAAVLALLAAAPAGAAEKPLRAGAAAGDITPPIGTPMFAYTARSRVLGPDNNSDLLQVLADPDRNLYAKTFVASKGIHMRLKARSVVIERAGAPFALVQVDLGGIPYALTQAVVERVAEKTGITQERLLISATHTHSAHGAIWPNLDNIAYGFVGGDLFDPRAWKVTVDGIAESILQAHGDLQAARVGLGATLIHDASRNRAHENFVRNIDEPSESIDPQVTVIRVDSRKGKPLAVWSNFAIHATSFGDSNLLFSGDNPGYTERIVERRIGKGVLNVWTNGNEGDISPNGGPDRIGDEPVQYVSGGFGSAHMAGARVADGILQAWEDAGTRMADDLELEARQSFMPFDGTSAEGEPVGPIPVLGAGGIVMPDDMPECAPVEGMAGPGQGFKFPLFGAPKIIPDVAPVSVWRVGDLAITALPSEVTKQMGARIRAAVAAAAGDRVSDVILAGLTDGYLSYTATPEEFDGCGYEGSMTLFGRRQGPRYRDFTAALAASAFVGAPAPDSAPEPAPTGNEPGPPDNPRTTPNPGAVLGQPAEEVARLGRATFRWQGGDRAVDAPRGETFVRLQRRTGNRWRTVATEDSFADTVRREPGDQYLETFQFGECSTLGEYRFLVTGRAFDGAAAQPYEAVSRTFRLTAAKLAADAPVVSGDTVSVRARYPDPGAEALTFLPRLVTTGTAELLVAGETVTAAPDPATGTFTAAVPAGSTATLVDVTDGCGNSTGD